ncbi:thiolase family protein [Embleya sp. NPDC001921]
MNGLRDVYLVDAVRTPIGRYGGALAGVRPDDLAATVLRALVDRSPGLDPARIDDVVLGAANGAGEDNRDVARMAVLLAGLPTSVPGVTVNRLCGSGLEAVIQAARAVAVGDASIVLAGGVESMSRAPWVLAKPGKGYPAGHERLHSTTLGWRLVNPRMPAEWTVGLGEATEALAAKYGVSRPAQDAYAAASHARADAAWTAGAFTDEVVPVAGVELSRDESIRPGSTPEVLATLKPSFRSDGTITAGNASPLNDGAAAVLVTDAAGLRELGREPLARITASGVHAVEPRYFGIGPVEAGRRALAKVGRGFADLDVLELNEAFAAQALACLGEWADLDPASVNPLGGALALGHPLGASGARVLGTLAHQLHRRGAGFGMAALCIGVGQGLAVTLEK